MNGSNVLALLFLMMSNRVDTEKAATSLALDSIPDGESRKGRTCFNIAEAFFDAE